MLGPLHEGNGTVLPPRVAKIEFKVDVKKRRGRVVVPGLLETTVAPIKNLATGGAQATVNRGTGPILYKPDVAILPLSGGRDPQDIVHMVRLLRTENPNLKTVIPHHHRLRPPSGAPTPADLENALRASGLPVRVLNPELQRVYELTK